MAVTEIMFLILGFFILMLMYSDKKNWEILMIVSVFIGVIVSVLTIVLSFTVVESVITNKLEHKSVITKTPKRVLVEFDGVDFYYESTEHSDWVNITDSCVFYLKLGKDYWGNKVYDNIIYKCP